MNTDGAALREMLLSEGDRTDLFPGLTTELRSKPSTKNLRVGIGPGVALFPIEPREDDRVKVTVTHEKLPTAEDVDLWKGYWSEWLEAIDQG